MSAEIPTDDPPQAKDSAKSCPQNAPPPYMDENLDEDTCPLISPPAASPQSQPDHYPAMPSCKLHVWSLCQILLCSISISAVLPVTCCMGDS